LGIVRFFRKEAKLAAPVVRAPEPPVEDAPVVTLGPAPDAPDQVERVIKQLEDDVLLTMRVITNAADDVQSKVSETIDLVDHIRSASVELSNLSGTAFEVTTGLADTTRQLESTGEVIERHVAGTDEFVHDAQRLAGDVTQRMTQLAEAVDRIAGVLAIIGAIARQTNLLALNASIEAARAGNAGRGFAVVATEVKELAGQVQVATGDIAKQIVTLQTVARESGASVDNIAGLLSRVGPVLTSVRDAMGTQIEGAREVAARAVESLQFVSVVSQKTETMTGMTAKATEICRVAGEVAGNMAPALQRLTQRSTAFLRHVEARDRREHPRVPLRISGTFLRDASAGPRDLIKLDSLDISRGGALVQPVDGQLAAGDTGLIDLEGIGPVKATIRSVSEDGCHVWFSDRTPEDDVRIAAVIRSAEDANRPLVKMVQNAATEIALLFEKGLQSGKVSVNDLITVEYRRIAGTDPIQYDTPATAFYEQVLPEIISRYRSQAPECLSIFAADRNSYVPVHLPEYSLPQRPGEYLWNDLHSRNKRIFERSKMLVAARNQQPSFYSSFMRHMPDNKYYPSKLVGAPIFVRGHLWGNFIVALGM
jgi:methyl-accepting chemotaxis protein